MDECRTWRQKVLVCSVKDLRASCGNEQSLLKREVVVDCNNHYIVFLFHQIFSFPTPLYLGCHLIWPFRLAILIWLKRNLAKLTYTWKLLALLGIAFSVAFGILWLMPWDETQNGLLNARHVSQTILNLTATNWPTTWQQMKEKIQNFLSQMDPDQKNCQPIHSMVTVNAYSKPLSFRGGLIHSKYWC